MTDIRVIGTNNITGKKRRYQDGDTILGAGGTPAWGSITGTISAQTDLQGALDGKAPTHSHPYASDTHDHTGVYEPADADIQTHITSDHAPSNAEQNVNSDWNAGSGDAQILNKPSLLALGETDTTAYRGDRGKTGYDHSQVAHAPSNAQKNSDITKPEIEAKLTGEIASHTHAGGADPFISKLVLDLDKATGANTTPVTLGLSFEYAANSKYVIDMYMLVSPTAAGTGCGFLIDVSTVVTYVGTFSIHQLAIAGTVSGGSSIGDLGATSQGVSSGMVGTGINFIYGGAALITAGNTGTATFYFRSETTAVTTCKAGSMIRVMKLA